MNKHEGCYRGYTIFSEAWYYEASKLKSQYTDEVSFGYYHPEGGTTGEMYLRWHRLHNEIAPELQAFNDSWDALSNMKDLIEELGKVNNDNITPKEFCAILDRLGFIDDTKRNSPYETIEKDMIVVQDEQGLFRLLGYENGQYEIVHEIIKARSKEEAKSKFRKLGYDIE